MLSKVQTSLCALIGAAFLALNVAPADAADFFRNLSRKHTTIGVAQFNHTNLARQTGDTRVLRLMNPVSVPQVAATLIYSRAVLDSETGEPDVDTEVYLGCRVDLLTPHGSLGIRGDDLPPFEPDGSERRYAEIIWAPTQPVTINQPGGGTREGFLADGLGGGATRWTNSDVANATLAHPESFVLPDNSLEGYEGQQISAILCVCQGLSDLGVRPDVFEDFKVRCNFPSRQ